MPPSGYPREDAETISRFLRSCAEALVAECQALGQRVDLGLQREIDGIDSVLQMYHKEGFALHTLMLTREFYVRCAYSHPANEVEFWDRVDQVLFESVEEIVSVHVLPLSER